MVWGVVPVVVFAMNLLHGQRPRSNQKKEYNDRLYYVEEMTPFVKIVLIPGIGFVAILLLTKLVEKFLKI